MEYTINVLKIRVKEVEDSIKRIEDELKSIGDRKMDLELRLEKGKENLIELNTAIEKLA